ncbi:hypothetical protein ABPG75_004970 [Micractinium tetrahymenae]
MGSGWLRPGQGIAADWRGRLGWYRSDWSLRRGKLRILAASTYIFCASAIPALAFGEQLYAETDGTLSAVHVLSATALTGVVQAVAGGQPLLIVGVAEPIVLTYKLMYDFAKDRDGLGPALFLPWCAWACVWAALLVHLLAAANACAYISRFTRFAGELFGGLIALLFMQQAIKGSVEEFRAPAEGVQQTDAPNASLANGLWSLLLAWGVLLCSLLCRQARSWRFLRSPLRAFLADYGAALMLVLFSALSFAVRGLPGVPRRVHSPNTWEVKASWTVARDMGSVGGRWIAAALVPALLIAILFFFDHNVSAQLAQQPEFYLRKPSAYHYDFMLLGLMTLACGLLGLPPVNGVLPQSPMHTKALATVKGRKHGGKRAVSCTQQAGGGPAGGKPAAGEGPPGRAHAAGAGAGAPPSEGLEVPSSSSSEEEEGDTVVAVQVVEQRVSGLLQSLGVAACLAAMPAIRQIPTAVLWGYFAFMAIESLPGSQLWDRLLLLLTDPRRRSALLERGHAPYLETVPFRTIAWFTLFQLAYMLGVYGITWAGVAGIMFPVPIMLLVPLRHWAMPRFFSHKQHLQELDAAHEEVAAPLSREQALQEAAAQGLGAPQPPAGSGASAGAEPGAAQELEGEAADLGQELHRFRVVHHLSRESLIRRRQSSGLDGEEAAAALEAGQAAGQQRGEGLPGIAGSPRSRLRRHSHDLQV